MEVFYIKFGYIILITYICHMENIILIVSIIVISFYLGWNSCKIHHMVDETSLILKTMSGVILGEITQEEATKIMKEINKK